MEVVYLVNKDGSGGGGGETAAAKYRIVDRVPEEGAVQLTDRCVTRVTLDTADKVKVVFPPLSEGYVRDFFVRLVITADTLPEITFTPTAGETLSFEDVDTDALKCEIGINIFSFTETDKGVFFVNRKQLDIEKEVEFDGCEGTITETKRTYKLGTKYNSFPTILRDGYVFNGWFTAPHDGVKVTVNDTVKTGVSKLYAQWSVYVDPFVDVICPAKNMTFFTSGGADWTVDTETYHSEGGSARSGVIGDSSTTSLTATIAGPGTLQFDWKASSESGYDNLKFYVDGVQRNQISGDTDWTHMSFNIEAGTHTVEWQYAKDVSVSSGSDCGWVDDVVWTPEGA